ncbi:MAG: hypothetical protein ABJN69_08230 [Hellea sp.]
MPHITPRRFKYWSNAVVTLLWGLIATAIAAWFSYAYWSSGEHSLVSAVITIVLLGLFFLNGILSVIFAIYDIVKGVWSLLAGKASEPDKYTSTLQEPVEVNGYGVEEWVNALGVLVFGLIAVPMGLFLIGIAIGPLPENFSKGMDDPIIMWGFAIIWLILSSIAFITGVIKTLRGFYLLFKNQDKRIG